MRRCTACFRFQPGTPTYCASCGRSFDVRICARGHHNPRGVQFCTECGSADLSTPAPAPSFLFRFSGFVLYLGCALVIGTVSLVAGLAVLHSIDWTALTPPLIELLLVLGLLYWTTTLLPGPVKKVGRAAGRQVMKAMRKDKRK